MTSNYLSARQKCPWRPERSCSNGWIGGGSGGDEPGSGAGSSNAAGALQKFGRTPLRGTPLRASSQRRVAKAQGLWTKSLVSLLSLLFFMSCVDGVPRQGESGAAMESVTLVPRAVSATIRRSTTRLVEVRTKDGVVVTTPEHPFARIGSGWTPAGELAEGDLVVSRTAPRGTPVLAVTTRAVPPTNVYNLTVDKTHSYLVGRHALLVHNVDCRQMTLDDHLNWEPITAKPTLRDYLAHERAREKAERNARLEAARRQHNATKPSCANCAILALLADSGSLKEFLDKYNGGRDITSSDDLARLKEKAGVITGDDTPPPGKFPASPESAARLKKIAERKARPDEREFKKLEREIEQFMKDSLSNTFVITYKYHDGGQYQSGALLAIRKPDGTIVYLDPSRKPPETRLDEFTTSVNVVPTNTDWRFNREINQLLDYVILDP